MVHPAARLSAVPRTKPSRVGDARVCGGDGLAGGLTNELPPQERDGVGGEMPSSCRSLPTRFAGEIACDQLLRTSSSWMYAEAPLRTTPCSRRASKVSMPERSAKRRLDRSGPGGDGHR